MSNCNNCTTKYSDYFSDELYTWCTACGNYGIHAAVKRALVAENVAPKDTLLCFDVGCHGNGSDKIGGYAVHGLHGRIIAFASGAAMANQNIEVIAFGGDGGTLSEGIGHLVHAVRSNYNMTFILHNNRNYGLTTGQASTTTPQDTPMHASPDGVTATVINPVDFVLSLEPTFVARSFSGYVPHMTEVIRAGMRHTGFSFIEILQDCPTYNKATPHEWYMERVYDVTKDSHYDRFSLADARRVASISNDKIATGVLFQNLNKKDFLSKQLNRKAYTTQLVDEVQKSSVDEFTQAFR
ncbi:hypothetical protein KC717_02515 [Candidatus Dojkabacteria bacterium]|uniref:2-oxoacid:ferredoxin oxidoreductase subunit beta n=1 Tax=Candidatus Dojkabacteria bacterium TaxID=2099670 RepID=A0A955RK74_9BACT|nr:hypothetical protein [Candidatus Dojkabacteria bacterium]